MLLLAVPLGLHATVVVATRPPRDPAVRRPARAGRLLATVLFADIVGSTERAREVGDRRWGELLDSHDRLGVEIRAGLHTGEVLVSRTVRDLVAGSDLALEERGAHALRGWPASGSCSRCAPEPSGSAPIRPA